MADNTAAIQALFDAVAPPGVVVLPDGVSEVGTINYRGQSIRGGALSVLLGKPGQDVLHLDSTVSIYASQGQRWSDFTVRVDDSVDASASFSGRAGVGNAGFASDYADGSADPTLMMNLISVENVHFESLSGTVGGLNKSCGVYTQYQTFNLSRWRNVSFWRLAYGLWDDYPRTHAVSVEIARDHSHYDSLYFNMCGRSWRMVNHGNGRVTNLAIHGGDHGLEMVGVQGPSRAACSLVSFDTVMIEAVGVPFTNAGADKCLFRGVYISGQSGPVVLAGIACLFDGLVSWNANQSLPAIQITGDYNTILLDAPGGVPMPQGSVEDLGTGNRVKAWRLPPLSALLTGTGNAAVPMGDGNRDVYLSEDDETPTVAGQAFLDTRLAFEDSPPATGLVGL